MNIWLDFCEPKSVIMLRPLYEKLIKEHDVFITARDFDSTYYLLNKWGIDYSPVGKYGGATLLGKLKAYSERLSKLIKIISKKNPDFLFCITSPEAMRISFGLQIPNIMFNDEPRSIGPCKMTFPYVDKIIVPLCIPLEWYLEYGLREEKIIRFNGIDEVAWLSEFVPNPQILTDLNLKPEQYVICRTEPTEAGYLIDKLAPYQTRLTEILPDLIKQTKDFKYIILTRNNQQFQYLNKFFSNYKMKNRVSIYEGLDNLTSVMYYAKMVMTGGGTMVRESALLGVPSIEFIPLITYPQEHFLINNGFPLKHEKETKIIITEALKFLEGDFKINTLQKIKSLENPINISLKEFYKRN